MGGVCVDWPGHPPAVKQCSPPCIHQYLGRTPQKGLNWRDIRTITAVLGFDSLSYSLSEVCL